MSDASSQVSHLMHENLETFSLVWLDEQVNTTEDNRQTQQELRQIINHLKTFDNQQRCYHYIMSFSKQDRLILIVSGRLGQQLVPQIHHLRQLSSIYIYCEDKKRNKKWTKEFPKVKHVIVRLDRLIHQIKSDQKHRINLEEPISINVYTTASTSDQSTTELNGHCVHSLLFTDCLTRMKFNANDKHELIKLCKNEYKNNNSQLNIVDEFEQEYKPNNALWWYTRECFLYRMLNKALRVQNIDLLFLFRFIIGDIYQKLQQHQCQSIIRVYRGQLMSNDELDKLHRLIGKLLSINSFFSTTSNNYYARFQLGSFNPLSDLERVLFIIDADPSVVTSKPFADIRSFSYFTTESEVLFMTGCVFRLKDINQNMDDKIWMIRMELYNDDQHDLTILYNHMKNEYGCGENEVSLQSFGDVLYRMGKYDHAEKMYNRLLGKLSPDDPSFSYLCYSFGLISKDRNEYDLSLEWFCKSLEIKMRTNSSDYICIGGLFDCIGNIHMKKGNSNEAMDSYKTAIEYYKKADAKNHPHMAASYHGIAEIYQNQKKYSEALDYYKQSLEIQQKNLPPDHSDIATNHNSIGIVYRYLNLYDFAMDHHNRSLAIRMKSLPSDHKDIAMSYKNIGLVYDAKNEWKHALIYYEKAAIIYRQSLSLQHPDLIEIERDIQRVSLQIT